MLLENVEIERIEQVLSLLSELLRSEMIVCLEILISGGLPPTLAEPNAAECSVVLGGWPGWAVLGMIFQWLAADC